MILRSRQKSFVERALGALDTHGNTLGVAPTGAGKTICLSAVAGALLQDSEAKACILAHRDELTDQNRSKFARVNPGLTTSVLNAQEKSWAGQATFAMAQTLCRDTALQQMPMLDLLVIDEGHHAAAPTYRRIIDTVRDRNPDARIFGVTATPNRGDGTGLRPVFSNVADQITLGELIASGHLVRPRTFVIDLGQQHELKAVRQTAADFDMTAVAAILNTAPINQEVVRHWREKAANRKTIVFCSTVAHATDVCQAFLDDSIGAVLIHGELSDGERKSRLREYEQGHVQVVVNVAVLTEGYDHPPTSCVVLLRPSSHVSTFIQMVGRGLRVVDPEEFPGVIKDDCLILDFGTASLMHGTLEQTVNLEGREFAGEAPQKECPQCQGWVPLGTRECPLCGFVWDKVIGDDPLPLSDIVMTEIDLLGKSSFLWCDLFGDDGSLMATGFHAWAGVFHLDGHWHAVGGGKNLPTRRLAIGERLVCLAQADDFLNDHETEDAAHKTRSWLNQPATEQQLRYLPAESRQDFGLTRYRASALLSFRFNQPAIRQAVGL
jgi:superfamily II DNA or RNA helicase